LNQPIFLMMFLDAQVLMLFDQLTHEFGKPRGVYKGGVGVFRESLFGVSFFTSIHRCEIFFWHCSRVVGQGCEIHWSELDLELSSWRLFVEPVAFGRERYF
jgi:hypothetical protein